MSAQNNSKNQYKDALKLLRKKCQNAETQYNGRCYRVYCEE